jgi:hypothetical protein
VSPAKALFLTAFSAAAVLGCAGPLHDGAADGQNDERRYVDDYDAAMDERRKELPRTARSLEDIKLIARANRLAAACTPGRNPDYTHDWLEMNRDREVRTGHGRRTFDEMGQDCRAMLRKLERRSVEACGARYVQLERHLTDDDSWTTPRVTRVSEGWYMTPCDKTPGTAGLKDLKEAEEQVREVCTDSKASFYLLARWSENPGGRGMVASVACLLPRQQRSDWLAGNPALGIKEPPPPDRRPRD